MHVIPPNGFPNVPSFAELDAIAKQIENLPTFTSNDRAFLEELPAFPSEDGERVLTATTSSGETSLSYEEVESELPENPSEDGTKVLTATTTSGETVLSWGNVESGENVVYSTTPVKIGKWLNKDMYRIVVNCGTLPNNETIKISFPNLANIDIAHVWGIMSTGSPIPFIYPSQGGIQTLTLYMDYTDNKIALVSNADYSATTGYVVIEYTNKSV